LAISAIEDYNEHGKPSDSSWKHCGEHLTMSVTSIRHIDVDEHGVARIVGKRTKVIQVVMDKMANGWTPEEIQNQYSHLSLAEIHAAFAYYYDNQDALDSQIEQSLRQAEVKYAGQSEPDVVRRLRDTGKLL